jgi:hypothetical protein
LTFQQYVILEQLQQFNVMPVRKKIKVEENAALERDSFSNAILNTDRSAYNAVVRRKKRIKQQENTICALQQQVQELLLWKDEIIKLLSKNGNK